MLQKSRLEVGKFAQGQPITCSKARKQPQREQNYTELKFNPHTNILFNWNVVAYRPPHHKIHFVLIAALHTLVKCEIYIHKISDLAFTFKRYCRYAFARAMDPLMESQQEYGLL